MCGIMQCPLCGYQMSAFDQECPRCHGKGIPKPPTPPQQVPPYAPYNPTIPHAAPPIKRGPNVWLILAIVAGIFVFILALPFLLVGGLVGVGSQIKGQIEADNNAALSANSALPAPTIAPVRAPVFVPTSTPSPIPTTTSPKARSVAPAPDESSGLPQFEAASGWVVYARKSMDAIRAAPSAQVASRQYLELLSLERDLETEKQRAIATRQPDRATTFGIVAEVPRALAEAADTRAKFLRGTLGEREYRAYMSSSDTTTDFVARQADGRASR